MKFAEYIWLDGYKPVAKIRSKTRVVPVGNNPKVADFPEWSFDGSSTMQAVGDDSDCILKPVMFVECPTLSEVDYLVLCEVFNPDGTEHESNTRAKLRKILDMGGWDQAPWLGFEQEYTMFMRNIPLGWPEHGYPAPQGPYYCGVGSEQIFGRELAREHAHLCMDCGLMYYGMNAEVMPGQWEFQIGYRGNDKEDSSALNISDHTWIARWLLHRVSENYDVHISLDNKPVKGDWNGAGMHTNISTKDMRDQKKGAKAIDTAVERLAEKHLRHIELYGDRLEERLTGLHETASIHEFSAGTADRGSSIRIPQLVASRGYGYIEDRRPGANADPYLVAARLIATICNIKDKCILPNSEVKKAG